LTEQEDEAAAKKRAEEAAAEAEYEKWRGAISTEAEGTVEQDAQEESQGMLGEFVEYIKVGTLGPLQARLSLS
jgi:hypothetical protein